MSISKYQLFLQVAENTGVDKQTVKLVTQHILDQIIEVLATEGRIELRNFGVFGVWTRRARKGRNPRTGEEVLVRRHKSLVFKKGLFMRKKVRGAKPNDAKPAQKSEDQKAPSSSNRGESFRFSKNCPKAFGHRRYGPCLSLVRDYPV